MQTFYVSIGCLFPNIVDLITHQAVQTILILCVIARYDKLFAKLGVLLNRQQIKNNKHPLALTIFLLKFICIKYSLKKKYDFTINFHKYISNWLSKFECFI